MTGPFPAADLLDQLAGVADRHHVHAVDLVARDAVGDAALAQALAGGGAGLGGAHGVAVVLDHVEDRQLPEAAMLKLS